MTQRVIKYRAYDMHFEEMCYVSSMFWPAKKKNGFDIVEGHGVTGTPYRDVTITEMNPLMQFTGLLDKHGKEIYEGDIMALLDASGKTKYLYIVKFEDAKFVLYHSAEQYGKWGDLHRAFDYDFRDYEFCKVGDIYTTPELVETLK